MSTRRKPTDSASAPSTSSQSSAAEAARPPMKRSRSPRGTERERLGSAAEEPIDAPHGSRPDQVYARLRELIVERTARPRQPHRRDGDRHATRRESNAGSRGAAAAAAGGVRPRHARRAAVATHGGAAHPRGRGRAAQRRRRARGHRGAQRAASLDPGARTTLGEGLREANADFHRAGKRDADRSRVALRRG